MFPVTLGSRTIPVLQLPTSNSNSSQGLNCSTITHSLTNQLFTSLHWHCTALHSFSPTVLIITSRYGPHRKQLFSVSVQLLLFRNQLPSSRRCITESLLSNGSTCHNIATCLGVCVTYRRVLDWMIVFIALIHSTRNYKKYSAIADLHTLQFTVTHTVRFSVFTSPILATDFNTIVIPVSLKLQHT
jgi:hypothetical protein